jgi:hypothetical protein
MPRICRIFVTDTLPGVSSRFKTGEFTHQAILREPIVRGNPHLFVLREEKLFLYSQNHNFNPLNTNKTKEKLA